jgi:hypothetical protein
MTNAGKIVYFLTFLTIFTGQFIFVQTPASSNNITRKQNMNSTELDIIENIKKACALLDSSPNNPQVIASQFGNPFKEAMTKYEVKPFSKDLTMVRVLMDAEDKKTQIVQMELNPNSLVRMSTLQQLFGKHSDAPILGMTTNQLAVFNYKSPSSGNSFSIAAKFDGFLVEDISSVQKIISIEVIAK